MALVLIFFAGCAVWGVARVLGGEPPASKLPYLVAAGSYWQIWGHTLSQPAFYLSILAILFLEWRFPAKRTQGLLSRGLGMDAFWTLQALVFYATLLPLFFAFLDSLYQRFLGSWTIEATQEWPVLVRGVLGYLAIDFLGWMHHLVRHKVPLFWEFHAVHHAQTELNLFSRDRVHPVDYLIAQIIKFLPLFVLGNGFGLIMTYVWISQYQDRLNHSNVRTNLGILRYVLVTPQSHRVHHSPERKHWDTNFGVTLSIWDHLFGTQYRNYDEYPETGIPDRDFPEDDASVRGVIPAWWRQFVYPLTAAVARTRRVIP